MDFDVIEPKLRLSIAFVDTAEAIWKNLAQRYAVINIPKVHRLKASVAECKQRGMEVVNFYAKLMSLWSELENQVCAPSCSCGKCECGINEKLSKAAEEEKAHQFLMG